MATIAYVNHATPIGGLDFNPGLDEILDTTPAYGAMTAKLFEIFNNDLGPYNGYKVELHSSANGGAGDFSYIVVIGSNIVNPFGTISGLTVRAPDGRVMMEIAAGAEGFQNAKLEAFHSHLTGNGAGSALAALLGKGNLFNGSAAADHMKAFGSSTDVMFGNGGDDVLWSPGAYSRTMVGGGGDDLMRVENGLYDVHGDLEDGTGGDGQIDTVEITGHVGENNDAKFYAFSQIDALRFVAGDEPPPTSDRGAEIRAYFHLDGIGGDMPKKLAVQGSGAASPKSANAIVILDDQGSDGPGITLDLSGWSFRNWAVSSGEVTIAGNFGAARRDVVIGSKVADEILAYGGDDTLRGGKGADILAGGTGDDTFVYGLKEAAKGELVDGGRLNSEIDSVVVRADNDFRGVFFESIERLKFAGKATATFDQTMIGNAGASVEGDGKANALLVKLDNATGGIPGVDLSALKFRSWSDSNDRIIIHGTRSQEIITGSSRSDVIAGREGRDSLQGGGGADAFLFDAGLGKGVDHIADFSRKQGDRILLDLDIFTKLKSATLKGSGVLKESAFDLGFKASDRADRILYDQRDGTLRYDDDGSGKHKAHVIAVLDGAPRLEAGDILAV